MTDDQGRVREVVWIDVLPWIRLVRAVKLSITPRALVLGGLGALATSVGWRWIGLLYSSRNEPEFRALTNAVEFSPWTGGLPNRVRPEGLAGTFDWLANGIVLPIWQRLAAPFGGLFDPKTGWVSWTYLLLCAVWALLVWSLFGASLTRIAALALAREDRMGLRASVAHACRKWPLYFGGPAIPLASLLLMGLPLALLGLMMRTDVGLLLAAVIWPLALALVSLMTILFFGVMFGWPLMWPTISAELSDPFDAVSRAYSYTFNRPFRYLFYVAVASVLGLLSWMVVSFFADQLIDLSYWGASQGAGVERTQSIVKAAAAEYGPTLTGAPRETPPGSEESPLGWRWGITLLGFWQACIRTLVTGFAFAFFWNSITVIYFLLRRDEDGMEYEEISVVEPGDAYGLPALQNDAVGVPAVSDSPAGVRPPDSPSARE